MPNGILLKFDGSHHAVVFFACLKEPSWSCRFALVPLLKLYWHGAKNVLPSCGGHLEHFSTDLYRKGELRKNHNSGTATMVEKDPEQRRCRAKE